MDDREERRLEVSADKKVGPRLSLDGGLTKFVGCQAINMPQAGFSKRDMLLRLVQSHEEFGKLSKSVE
jgi:hypothetical protein